MLATNSPPPSFQKSTLELAFREAVGAWQVPPNLSGSEWADTHFQLAGASSEKGRWTSRPFQREILDVMAAPYPTEVTIKKSARVGYTKMICADVAYHMAHDPADMLIAQPTDDDAKDFMKDEIAPMIDAMPLLSDLCSLPSVGVSLPCPVSSILAESSTRWALTLPGTSDA